MFKHLFVPTDGSALSIASATRAVRFAQEVSAKITVFFVKPEYPVFYFGEGAAFDASVLEDFNESSDLHAKAYTQAVADLCAKAGVPCEIKVVTHNIVHLAIVENAESVGADLIFMASHGRTGLSSLLLGGETQKVLAHTKIPVLVHR